MNWLAHVFLSGPDIEERLGNLLADLVKGRDRERLGPRFLRGVQCHQAIDAYTDFHPVVERARGRLLPSYGRVAGILIDIFYDHFLARDWARYCPVPLDLFTANFYTEARACPLALPEKASEALHWMIVEDRLGSYRDLGGIEVALSSVAERLQARVRQSFGIEGAIPELVAHYDDLAGDFAEFFPDLQAHVERRTQTVP